MMLAALSQYPERMAEFFAKYEWCWVGHRKGRFEHRLGSLPKEFREHCPPMARPEAAIKWSTVMSMQEVAKIFNVSRNTVPKLLKTIRHMKVPGGVMIDVTQLPAT